jgi:hypothetical protein
LISTFTDLSSSSTDSDDHANWIKCQFRLTRDGNDYRVPTTSPALRPVWSRVETKG